MQLYGQTTHLDQAAITRMTVMLISSPELMIQTAYQRNLSPLPSKIMRGGDDKQNRDPETASSDGDSYTYGIEFLNIYAESNDSYSDPN